MITTMSLSNKIFIGLFPFVLLGADELKIETTMAPREIYNGSQPLKFTLTLDQPADSAKLIYFTPRNVYFQINGENTLSLKPSADKKVFTGELTNIKNYFHPQLNRNGKYGKERISVIPAVTRDAKEIRLKAEPFPRPFAFPHDLMITGNALPSTGKFDTGINFDGKTAMAAIRKIDFDPEKGSVEMWVFLPLVIQPKSGIVFYLECADGSPWSYHCLSIPAKSRKLDYLVYYHKERKISRIRTEEITNDDFIHVKTVWDIHKKKLELFLNGKSAGTIPYTVPSGGKKSMIFFGGRIHNTKEGPVIIGNSQMVLDEFRVTNNPKFDKVPENPYIDDPGTFLLLHFNEKDFIKDSCKHTSR